MKFENPLWQSSEWEEFQENLGNSPVRIEGILLIERKTAFGKSFFEIPRTQISKLSAEFWRKLEQEAKKKNVLFSRVFPAGDEKRLLPSGAILKGIPEIFPGDTLALDLIQSEEELLAQMKPKGRYNISLAERKGVKITHSNDVSAFYTLLQETMARDGFSGHPLEVYESMLKSFSENGLLLLAQYEDEVIAGGIFLFCQGVCTYYYGASSNAHRNLMAPYLVQWEALKEAKKRGCAWYDFLGIAPENSGPEHHLFGVSQFKEKFGGLRVKYAPAFEIMHQKFWYRALKLLKRIRRIF